MVASPMWREFLAEYIKGLKNLPELIRRISFKRRNLDDELVEVSPAHQLCPPDLQPIVKTYPGLDI